MPHYPTHYSFSSIDCNPNGRVASLNIVYVSLFGALPPGIDMLGRLFNLTLLGTNLTCPLQVKICRLTSPKLVNINQNAFADAASGEVVVGFFLTQGVRCAQEQFLWQPAGSANNNFSRPTGDGSPNCRLSTGANSPST
ncbi:leucine-rich repeat receptor-like protein kinase [Striga asiatica]|uniref:Leucine-rich repeat receptor-like protein kinase n=1 Tax=Striga asiatica TaxID=4170 RepID=A0A5A7Q3S5_STRAF|nr:leucine-rich repeat receptor-like protein kinase [Striga asiatica]